MGVSCGFQNSNKMLRNFNFWKFGRAWAFICCSFSVLILIHLYYSPLFSSNDSQCCRKRVTISWLGFTTGESEVESSCGDEATETGIGQKVISYSLYGTDPMFWSGLEPNLEKIRQLYPGWVVRLYTNAPRWLFCRVLCRYDFLYWCDIHKIPEIGDLAHIDQRSWRFLPLGDPLVDIFVSRDLDSLISQRERDAVQEWEDSNSAVHSMRDHPWHAASVLGGMWGAKNTALGPHRSKCFQRKIIEEAKKFQTKGWDQTVLNAVLYGELSKETMAHDSYFCGTYPDGITLAFPTQREKGQYVGNVAGEPITSNLATCPAKCRKHPSWTEC